jgi:hypothetical protein
MRQQGGGALSPQGAAPQLGPGASRYETTADGERVRRDNPTAKRRMLAFAAGR